MKRASHKSIVCATMPYLVSTLVGFASEPIANLTERWTESSQGWIFTGPSKGTASYTNQALMIRFNSRSPDSPLSQSTDASDIIGMSTASQGRFAGDYSKIESLSFDVCASNVTSACFYFGNGGRLWANQFDVSSSQGKWIHISLPIVFSSWTFNGGEATADDFAADRRNVTDLYIEVAREMNCYSAQTLLVDNLKVVGPWTGPFTNGVSIYWIQECGLVGKDADAFADPDGDGLSNLGEFLAGSVPTDPSSSFKVSIAQDDQGRTVLRWPHAKGRTFGIWKATDLTAEAGFTKMAQHIEDQGTDNSLQVDNSESGVVLYRVEIEQ